MPYRDAKKKLVCRQRWMKNNHDKTLASARKYWLKQKYDLTIEEYQYILNMQAGLCCICCEPMNPQRDTHVDHDHDTGLVRGLLCSKCNSGIGYLKDSLAITESAFFYLQIAFLSRPLPMMQKPVPSGQND